MNHCFGNIKLSETVGFIYSIIAFALFKIPVWLSMTPFAFPDVPELNMIKAVSFVLRHISSDS